MNTLRYGAMGLEVKLMQLALMRAGNQNIVIDGVFGPQTQQAVLEFQKTEGITQDGIVGNETWQCLAPYLSGYRVIRVKEGDSFYKLAKEIKTTVEAIKTANPDVDQNNLQIGKELIVPFGFPLVTDKIAYSTPLVEAIIKGLEARYPFISIEEYGRSVLGKKLYGMKIGTGKTKVSFGGGIHANEWITTPLLLKFAEEYAETLARDQMIGGCRARELYQKVTLYITPFQNPDGIDLVTGMLYSGAAYELARRIAMSYPSIPFPSGWKANIRGIDLNLQFPAGWEKARVIKYSQGFRSPAPRDYVGSMPFEAPEASFLAEYTEKKAFGRLLCYHTQGQVIYWQYNDKVPDEALELGQELEKATGYPLTPTPQNSAYAGYKDWFIEKYGKPGYTLEVGIGRNPLPITQLESIYKTNLPGFITAMKFPGE